MAIIVEIIGRNREVKFRHRFESGQIHIGRAFNNDIIINDPYVCPLHATLTQSEEGWSINDSSQINGIHTPANQTITHRALQSGDEFYFGKTLLRFLWSEQPVEPTLPLVQSWAERIPNSALFMIALTLTLIGFAVLQDSLNTHQELNLKRNFADNGTLIIPLGLWAGLWALIGKIARHQTRFVQHFVLGGLLLLLSIVLSPLDSLIEFNSQGNEVFGKLVDIIVLIGAAIMLYGHLSLATHWTQKKSRASAIVTVVTLTLVSFLIDWAKSPEDNYWPEYSTSLLSPKWKLVSDEKVEHFFERNQTLFEFSNEEMKNSKR